MIHRWVKHVDSRSESIWLTIYADMITNLMLVFLALYGLTAMGRDAVARATESMKMSLSPVETSSEFGKLVDAIQQSSLKNDDIRVTEEAGAIRVQFGESVLFRSGRAELKPDAYEPLLKLAAALKSMPNTIVVEGHTDNVRLGASAGFHDNYELSLARAMNVVDVLIKQAGVPAGQVAAAAYGEHRPRSTNETLAGRRANRRVEIAVFRDFPFPERPPLPRAR